MQAVEHIDRLSSNKLMLEILRTRYSNESWDHVKFNPGCIQANAKNGIIVRTTVYTANSGT